MGRAPREDHPGAWHHVYNRALARRPMFESGRDVRFFLSLVARVVRKGLIEVHAYSVLTTHFHLLLRSVDGRLPEAMWHIENPYARAFNRGRRRDGPIFRGRYGSRLIRTDTYREAVLWYIDANPVEAGLSASPADYPHGSALRFAAGTRPRWLSRGWVEAMTCEHTGAPTFEPSAYRALTASGALGGLRDLARRRVASRDDGEVDVLDDLVRAAPPEVQRWMERKARLADGTPPAVVLLRPATVLAAVQDRLAADPAGTQGAWRSLLEHGLLRTVCGLTFAQVAGRLATPFATAHRLASAHVRRVAGDPDYARCSADIVHAALAADFRHPRRKSAVATAPGGA